MGKNIYINSNTAEFIIDKLKPMKKLPKDIKNALRAHNTSLGNHPCFPPDEELSFDEKVTLQRFGEIKKELLKYEISDFSEDGIKSRINDIIKECKEIEAPFKDKLEKLCYNYIIDTFKVPEGYVNFTCNIVEKVDDSKANVSSKPEEFSFSNINHMSRLSEYVYKRRLIDALSIGAAIRMSNMPKELIGDIYEINDRLPKLYKEVLTLNDYLLFFRNKIGISYKNKKQAGISYLTLGNDVTKNKIEAEGEIFPILLYESIKGFMEMFAVYGLPSKRKDAEYVMEKADILDTEPWDMRLGPVLWDILVDTLDFPETEDLPSILLVLYRQRPEKFNRIMKEFFGLTDYSKVISEKILDKAKQEREYSDFEELMAKKNTDKSLISDGYFTEEEL